MLALNKKTFKLKMSLHSRIETDFEIFIIQWTEFYEYSKVLGNSQFQLLTFQPYKLIYAHMLAEVGKVSDSIK